MKPILYILSLIIIVGCAQQSMLTGGEKDIVGPALIQEKTIPENYSTLFNSNVIQLHFNEYVQLKDQKKNFFVNPPIDNIQLEEKGKSIFIHIDESLRENTTYTFNFGSSIRDITENNPFQDFKYVTSTGNYIDSNFFRGIVYDAFSKESIENIKIFLYEKQLDSLNESILPNYMGYSDNSGNFMLNNLKEGRYYVLAVEDKNGNSKPDPINEKIAFDTSFVIALNPGDTSYKDTLQLFMHNKTLKVIEKKYSPPGKVDVVFNKKLLNSDVKITNRNYYIHQKEFPSDTFSFWIDSIPEAPLSFEITVEKEDFLKELKVNTYESSTKDTVLTFKERNLNNLRPDKPLQLLFNHPIKKINSEKLHFLIDSIDSEKNYSFNDELWSMKIPEIPNTSLEILAEPGAFQSIYGYVNDSINLIFRQKEKSSYGDIYLNVNCKNCNSFIIQLLRKDDIIQSFNCNDHTLIDTVAMCKPGSYKLRMIHDLNGDGEWTTGNYNTSTQPEPVYYYNDPMEIKAGWNLNVRWIIQ